jgi:hypothetical protein
MRPISAETWSRFFMRYDRLHFHTVDPGAHAVACELVPLVHEMGRLGDWFGEGWSAAHESRCRPADALLRSLAPGDAVVIGSQTNVARTQAVLQQVAKVRASSIFVFDHWKSYAEHFGGGPLADAIVVPDEVGRGLLTSALGRDVEAHVEVLPHVAIEAAADRILASNVSTQPGCVTLLLDPTEPEHGLGYDWRTTMAALADYPAVRRWERIAVRPHPRQDATVIAPEVAALRGCGIAAAVCLDPIEQLIAQAQEIWGMTTIGLNVALAVGKPIRSFQIGRNDKGARMSNPHIEPFVVS